MEFDWNVDIAIKAVQAREKIDAIRDQLPGDVQRYFVQKFSTNDAPILQLRLSGQSGNVATAYDMLERHLKRPLERIPGVAKVEIQGIGRPEVQIEISSDRLNAHGIRLDKSLPASEAGQFRRVRRSGQRGRAALSRAAAR